MQKQDHMINALQNKCFREFEFFFWVRPGPYLPDVVISTIFFSTVSRLSNGAFGKRSFCLCDTRHCRHFRRFPGSTEQNPSFFVGRMQYQKCRRFWWKLPVFRRGQKRRFPKRPFRQPRQCFCTSDRQCWFLKPIPTMLVLRSVCVQGCMLQDAKAVSQPCARCTVGFSRPEEVAHIPEMPSVLLGIPWPALRGPLRNHFWKRGVPSRTELGREFWKCSGGFNALNYRFWGIPAVLSRGLPGKALRAFPGSFRNFSTISSRGGMAHSGRASFESGMRFMVRTGLSLLFCCLFVWCCLSLLWCNVFSTVWKLDAL